MYRQDDKSLIRSGGQRNYRNAERMRYTKKGQERRKQLQVDIASRGRLQNAVETPAE